MTKNPSVSIILPTYNRATFLPSAFESISKQTFTNWELIVVDDGSTDETASLVKQFASNCNQRIEYIFQDNAGAGAARSTALNYIEGDFVAFFDSDDLWLPHHLEECCQAFKNAPEVDWIFTASEVVDFDTQKVLISNSLHPPKGDRKVLELKTYRKGDLYIINDERKKLFSLKHGSFGGFQSSVLRRKIVENIPFPKDRVGDDSVFGIKIIVNGYCAGYFDKVHVQRFLHDEHVSLVQGENDYAKKAAVTLQFIKAHEELLNLESLSRSELLVLKKMLAEKRFWLLGYSVYLESGDLKRALHEFKSAIKLYKFNIKMIKTFLLTQLKYSLFSNR